MNNKNKGLAKFFIVLMILITIAVAGLGAICLIDFVLTGESYNIVLAIICLILVIISLSFIVGNYNKLVKLRNRIEQSFSLIDVYLKMRFDLIPNLVSTVKGYMKHEQSVLESLIELRNKGIETKDEKEKIELSNQIVPEIKRVLFIAEDYPELQADKLFKSLMNELSDVENKIAASRRFYNSNIKDYNNTIETFPSSIIAKAYKFEKREMFKIEVNEKIVVNVDLDNF